MVHDRIDFPRPIVDNQCEMTKSDQKNDPIPYMQRTRDWYLALGYGNPYVWAQFDDVPFQPLDKPLADCTVALITTAAPYRADAGEQGPNAPYNAAAKFYEVYSGDTAKDHDLRISHVAIDRDHTSMEDSRAWFPLQALREAAAARRIGKLAPRFHGAPTNRSQRHTAEVDAPEILRRCKEDGANAAVLFPNCPVCHQTLSLTARHLEANGIATVILGCAKDIVEHCGVPRFLFSDFPLGNPAGRPHEPDSQAETLEKGLTLLESATGPRTTVQSPIIWSEDPSWKRDYNNVEKYSEAELAEMRAENEAVRIAAKELRQKTING
jgi:D-proline reductase (dithiol) PrdB